MGIDNGISQIKYGAMKRRFKSYISLTFILLIAWLGWKVKGEISEKAEIAERRAFLPGFHFRDLKGGIFSSSSLPKDTAVVIMYIHPECPHCQYEAEILYEEKDLHKHINWVLISEAEKEQIEGLNSQYKLQELKNVILLKAEIGDFYGIFGTEVLPSTFIYDQSHSLVKHYSGEVKLAAILNQLQAN